MYGLLIRNGRIADGTGLPSFVADVAVKDGRIAKIGCIKDAATKVIEAGPLTLGVEYRNVNAEISRKYLASLSMDPAKPRAVTARAGDSADGGVSLHVFARESGKLVEYFRIDCFGSEPHYHYCYPKIEEQDRVFLDKTVEPDAQKWAYEKLERHLPAILKHVGADDLSARVRSEQIRAVLPQMRKAFAEAAAKAA